MSLPLLSCSLSTSSTSFEPFPAGSTSSSSSDLIPSESTLKRSRTFFRPSDSGFLRLPGVLQLAILSYLFFDELAVTKRVCPSMSCLDKLRPVIFYKLSSYRSQFDKKVFLRTMHELPKHRIRMMDLSRTSANNLRAAFTSDMPALETLHLSHCARSGMYMNAMHPPLFLDAIPVSDEEEIPALLTQRCFNLTSLDFSRTDWADRKLSQLILPKLKLLNLSGNHGIFPIEIASLSVNSPLLEELYLDDCDALVTNVLGDLKLPNLRILSLCSHKAWIAYAHLFPNSLQDSISHLSGNCPNLERLILKQRGNVDLTLLKLPKLFELNLLSNGEKITNNKELASLALNSPKMRILHLDAVDQHFNISVIKFSLLEELTLSGLSPQKTEDFLSFVTQCPKLHSLMISDSNLTAENLETFKHLTSLTSLNLNGSILGPLELRALSTNCPQLKVLNILNDKNDDDDNPHNHLYVSDEMLDSCVFPNLTEFRLRNCNKISAPAFFFLSNNCPKIERLDLAYYMANREDTTMMNGHLAQLHLPELTQLNFAGHYMLSDERIDLNYYKPEVLAILQKKCPKLKLDPVADDSEDDSEGDSEIDE